MATDNEAIQRANERAAKYEAEAIKHKGLAEAEVKKAKYAAVKKDILQLETEKAIAQYKYQALPNVKLNMPSTVVQLGGNGSGSTTIEDLANMSIIDKVGNLTTKETK